jgi:outer membrane lipoprotein-sorting protein
MSFRALAPVLLTISAVALLSGLTHAGSEAPADNDKRVRTIVSRLQEKAASLKTLEADFTQEKTLASFRYKIVLKGKVYLKKPGVLAWHVHEPMKSSVLITEKFVRQWDEETGNVRETGFSGNPMLRTVVNQMTVWFNGDYSTLLEDYNVVILGESPVELEFRPKKGSRAKKRIESISVGFQEDERYLRRLSIIDSDGDASTIYFDNIRIDVPLGEDVFQVGGRV